MLSLFSHVHLFATLWTVIHQAPLSVGFSRQAHWSGVPFSSPGDLPYPGIEPASPALQADPLPSQPSEMPQIKPIRSFKFTHEPQLLSLCSRAQELQLLSPLTLEPRSAAREATSVRSPHATTRERAPLAEAREKPAHRNKGPAQSKINKCNY